MSSRVLSWIAVPVMLVGWAYGGCAAGTTTGTGESGGGSSSSGTGDASSSSSGTGGAGGSSSASSSNSVSSSSSSSASSSSSTSSSSSSSASSSSGAGGSGGGSSASSSSGAGGGTAVAGWALDTSSVTKSYVTVANLAIPTDFTVETWVKPTAIQNEQILLSKQVSAVQANQFRLGIESGWAYFMMTGGSVAGDLYGPNGYVLTSPIVAGVWTHLAVTKSGATFVFYVNGVGKVTHTASALLQHTGTALFELASTIASSGVAPEKILDGTIDEIRIWDVALPGAEILADMGKTISPAHAQYAHLVSYYKLDDGTGTVATDTKGTYPGTLVNAPTWVMSTAPTGM